MNTLTVYEAPTGARGREDFHVRVRTERGDWKKLFVYEVKVDMHKVREASMVYFDMSGAVTVEIGYPAGPIEEVTIRPREAAITYTQQAQHLTFTLEKPCKLSIEINGDRFHNLHLFANPLELEAPDPHAAHVLLLQPAIHRTEEIWARAEALNSSEPQVVYFAPGMHYIEETLLRIPSNTTIYIAGGAVVVGSLVCDHTENITIRGRGILDLSAFHRFSAFRGVRLLFARNIAIEGLILLDPPHYSIYIGQSKQVQIQNFKSFSTRGWSDGIDMMASSDIMIQDVFLRTSDDCIAIYASRWNYKGDTRRVKVSDSILWADVAHPLMMGTHGDPSQSGDVIEDIHISNIDILEHHEPQENYWGAIAINAGDKNTIRNVTYERIRVEEFEQGQLIDIRVVWNKDYNPVPGQCIEQVTFRDIRYYGENRLPNRIYGFDAQRRVKGVHFQGLHIQGQLIMNAQDGNFDVNEYAEVITFSENPAFE